MNEVVIVDAVRTPIGRSHAETGWFRDVRGDDLAVACVQALLERTRIDPACVEDILLGCTQQTLEQGVNVARLVGLMAGLPPIVPGVTINRLCGSSLQAIHQAAHAILAGCENVQIVGGLEQMLHLPMGHGTDWNPKLFRQTSKAALIMGITAEFLARRERISRADQDQFALRSHQRAVTAQQTGKFSAEIVPVLGRDEQGLRFLVDRDQCVRRETSLAALAALEPVFVAGTGTITAGNSSPLNDGASALLMMSRSRAGELGLRPLVRIRATAIAGVEPAVMGTGPVPATRKALARAGLQLTDVDLVELNEAFAAQALACIRQLGLDEQRVNVQGGALALGHPLGASGARIATTLIHAMRDRDATFGLATMCIGFGQGIATIFERIE